MDLSALVRTVRTNTAPALRSLLRVTLLQAPLLVQPRQRDGCALSQLRAKRTMDALQAGRLFGVRDKARTRACRVPVRY